jgi:hypothetical protein
MSDSKQNVGQQDRLRVDVNDPSEVEFVHQEYPKLSHAQVLEAICEKGPMRKDVYQYLDSLNVQG